MVKETADAVFFVVRLGAKASCETVKRRFSWVLYVIIIPEFVFGKEIVMKSVHQSKALFRGTFILTIAALITKILSAFYRIPFQNIVGDVGFYIYQQIYPFYGIAIVLGTTGFPVVI